MMVAKRLSTEDHLALLRQLRAAPKDDRVAALRELLGRSQLHGIVVKGAAAMALECGARELSSQLVEAGRSLMGEDAVKRDPGCEAKAAISRALVEWESDEGKWFVELSRHRQMEPTFGGSVDRAGECRGLAAIGIARLRPEGAIFRLADLLADSEKATRLHAAMALGLWRGPEAMPVLRLKARTGDDEAEVMGEVFASLLRSEDGEHVPMVCEQLKSANPQVAEVAALALGQSRIADALVPLAEAWEKGRRTPIASTMLMAIGLLRTEASVEWLLGKIGKVRPGEAVAIVDSLRIYRGDDKIRTRLAAAVRGIDGAEQVFREVFGD